MGEGEAKTSCECWLGKAGWLVETPLGTSGCRPSRGSRDTLFKYLKIKDLLLTRFPWPFRQSLWIAVSLA